MMPGAKDTRSVALAVGTLLLAGLLPVWGYVEAPHSLGQVIKESTNIVVMEVTQVNAERGLIIFKKVRDLKGQHPEQQVKHNIGKRGFHPREWQTVMAWAQPGKTAVFFHNGQASETCLGNYWYQCYREGEWWGMSHAEPFLLRTYFGNTEKLSAAVERIGKGEEVVVTCLADGKKEQLHQRKGKVQRLRASLKRLDYNAQRDFVAWGGSEDDDFEEFKTVVAMAESSDGWRFLPASQVKGDAWRAPDFDDSKWRPGKAPIGYGEPEIANRRGTQVVEQGQDFVFRRAFEVPADLLTQKGVVFRLAVASDNNAIVHLNGVEVDREDGDHEFTYWNREIELPAGRVRAGRNVIALHVRNTAGSSDLFADAAVTATIPIVKPPKKPMVAAAPMADPGAQPLPTRLPASATVRQGAVVLDLKKRSVTIQCVVAPRKLPQLDKVYPIEVIATYPSPDGQKAHETVLSYQGTPPSAVHQALEMLGLKAGKPARGEGTRAEGPVVKVVLEFTDRAGKLQAIPVEELLVDRNSGKAPAGLKWHFTGSARRQPNPERDETVYGADLTGTLLALFPVTDDTVLQSSLTLKEEAMMKLEVREGVLPAEGTPARLVLSIP